MDSDCFLFKSFDNHKCLQNNRESDRQCERDRCAAWRRYHDAKQLLKEHITLTHGQYESFTSRNLRLPFFNLADSDSYRDNRSKCLLLHDTCCTKPIQRIQKQHQTKHSLKRQSFASGTYIKSAKQTRLLASTLSNPAVR